MAPLGPFEPAPRLAVAVSGGADSLALAVLLGDWVRARRGSLVALIVDHRLRAGSGTEARQVAGWCAGLGLERHILSWRGAKPEANRQAAARRARYDLLSTWCLRHGVVHLATAHHRDDQAETLLLRLGRGSGLDGLAAMAAVNEQAGLRLLRPLLPLPKARLCATLEARGLAWIEDPSNRDPAYARTAARRLLTAGDGGGLSGERLAAAAGHLGRARAALEGTLAALLAESVAVDPAGFAWLEPAPLCAAGPELALRALSRVLLTVGGAEYTPRLERLERLHGRLRDGLGRGATLAGCRILPRRGRLLVVREAAAADSVPVRPGERLRWDGRFEVAVSRKIAAAAGPLRLGPLGEAGRAALSGALRRVSGPQAAALPPPAARPGLPALSDRRGLLAVPHLGYLRGGDPACVLRHSKGKLMLNCVLTPAHYLSRVTFTVA